MSRVHRLIIWGAGGFAGQVITIVDSLEDFVIAGLVDDVDTDRKGSRYMGHEIHGGKESLAEFKKAGVLEVVLAFGNNHMREQLSEYIHAQGFELCTVVHPSAVIAPSAKIGSGCVVAAGAVVENGCVIGDGVIVDTGATISHDTRVDSFAHLCPGVNVAGRCRVGKCSMLGVGSSVMNDIIIGKSVLLGAGACAVRNVADGRIAYGVPAVEKRDSQRDF